MSTGLLTPSRVGGVPESREFGDLGATRDAIYERTRQAAANFQPVENQQYRLALENVGYEGADQFSIADQKAAIIQGTSLGRRLRGEWVLRNREDDSEVDRRRITLAQVPYLTSRGTYIFNGTEYGLAHQMRLRPGIFTREKESGELESHVNVAKGFGHRYFLDPKTGVFRIQLGQARIPLMPVLKALGMSDSDIRKAWGNELYAANAKAGNDAASRRKVFMKIKRGQQIPSDPREVDQVIRDTFAQMELDPEVTQRTLGQNYSKVDPETIVRATNKLLAIGRGEEDPDDRDAMAFQRIMGPEDIFAERIGRGAGEARKLLWKATFPGNLGKAQAGTFSKSVRGALLDTGLGASLEEINPAELMDQTFRVTRMGEGGIPSVDSIPDDARDVQPSHLGFIDAVHTPECYDAQTEVMTWTGWKPWPIVTSADQFACLVHGELQFCKASRLIVSDYTGDMYGARSAVTEYLVTPNHRLWVRPLNAGSDYRIEEAIRAHGSARKVRNGGHGAYRGDADISIFRLPQVIRSNATKEFGDIPIADWADFMGWYLSKGCVEYSESTSTYLVKLSQSRDANPENCQMIESLLDSLGWRWCYTSSSDYVISGRQLASYLHQFGFSYEKYIPEDLLRAPEEARQRLFESMLCGDGRKQRGRTTANYCSTSQKLAEDFQRLAFGLGISTRIVFEPDVREQSNHGGCWVVHTHFFNEREFHKRLKSSGSGHFRQHYDGKVYCATVPGGLLYVRRGDKGGHWSGNSSKIGVDSRIATQTRLGKDGRLYARFKDQQGQLVWRSPQDLADEPVAFPGEMESGEPWVQAIAGGRQKYVKRDDVKYSLNSMDESFGPLASLVPLKSAAFPQRVSMGARMMTQALPLVDGEAPLVRSGIAGEEGSYEERYGTQMGAVRSEVDGTVLDVAPDKIRIRGADRRIREVELYDNFPYNRKTFMHSTPVVRPGDRVTAGGLLARSNFTDGKGVTALGKNVRVAYIPYKGYNFEDAIVMTESAATRFSSEHLYQHDLDLDDDTRASKNAFLSTFPGKYGKEMLKQFDVDGIIKPGTKVRYDDPLVLAVKHRTGGPKLGRRKRSFADASVIWDHHAPGVVTDVYKGKKGINVIVKSTQASQVGDKFAGRYGDKGVLAAIIPDDEAPRGPDGRPYEVLLNPGGIISRGNPAQAIEAWLGRVASATGQPISLPDFNTAEAAVRYAKGMLQKHGLTDRDVVTEPSNKRNIPNVLAGNRFIMKLHHTAEAKLSGRATGGYTSEESPAKGGAEGSKRVGMLELNAMLSHGAYGAVHDVATVRGQRNEDYWRQVMSGYTPPNPKVPFVYRKFVESLKGAGINPIREGAKMNVYAMSGQDVDEMVGDRELQNVETVDWKSGRLAPKKGGLFDESITGGHGGERWSYIRLNDPFPNPVMEEPIRRILGLTEKQYRDVLAGGGQLQGRFSPRPGDRITTGPGAIMSALDGLDLDREIKQAQAEIAGGRKTYRDAAIRRLGFLKAAKVRDKHPREWIWNKMPVLPPAFRTISVMAQTGTPLVADPNLLYKELWDANEGLKFMKGEVDDVSAERLAVYDSMKAVVGLGDPIQPKLQEQKVRGILKHVFGQSPKYGIIQRKLLGSTVDLVGRATITPNPRLDMDQVGLPIDKAWVLYQPFTVRRLVRRGMPKMQAMQQVKDRSALAKKEMMSEMQKRPVIVSRAPILHRYGVMAFWPQLTQSDTLEIPPIVTGGFGADFDGDAQNYNLPATDAAVRDAVERMLPSKNLFSPGSFKVHYTPSHEYQGGLWAASTNVDKKPERVFRSKQDAIRAYQRGEISVGQRVTIQDS